MNGDEFGTRKTAHLASLYAMMNAPRRRQQTSASQRVQHAVPHCYADHADRGHKRRSLSSPILLCLVTDAEKRGPHSVMRPLAKGNAQNVLHLKMGMILLAFGLCV
jgi:hypothetical protein